MQVVLDTEKEKVKHDFDLLHLMRRELVGNAEHRFKTQLFHDYVVPMLDELKGLHTTVVDLRSDIVTKEEIIDDMKWEIAGLKAKLKEATAAL